MSAQAKKSISQPKQAGHAPPKGNGPATSAMPFVKKAKPVVLNPVSTSDIGVVGKNIPGLRDPIVIAFGVPGQKIVQYTIHRKIGIDPDIPDDGWVLSQTADLPGFLENQKDPRVTIVNEKINTMRTELLIKKRLVSRDEEGRIVYFGTSTSRAEAKKVAQAAFETYKKIEPLGERKLLTFFDDNIAERELAIEEALMDSTLASKTEKLKLELKAFVTLGGPGHNVRQKELVSVRGIKSSNRAIAAVLRLMWASPGTSQEGSPPDEFPEMEEKTIDALKSEYKDVLDSIKVKTKILSELDPKANAEQVEELKDELEELIEQKSALRQHIADKEDEV